MLNCTIESLAEVITIIDALKNYYNDEKASSKEKSVCVEKEKKLQIIEDRIKEWENVLTEQSLFSSNALLSFLSMVLNQSEEKYSVITNVPTEKNTNDVQYYDVLTQNERTSKTKEDFEENDPNAIILPKDTMISVLDGVHISSFFENIPMSYVGVLYHLVDTRLRHYAWSEDQILEEAVGYSKEYVKKR